MDFGSLDFETWRLVGLGFLTLGALATVIAIVAIITMFRDGGTDDDRRYPEAQWDDEDDHDEGDESDDDVDDRDDRDDFDDRDEHEDDDHEDRRTKVAAGSVSRDRDSGPSSTSLGLGKSHESLFTVPAKDPPRQPIRSTRDEPHVPSPDWYEYADAEPVGDLDDDLVEALEAKRRAEPPSTPVAPPVPVQSVAPPARPEESRRRASSPWFEDIPGDEKPGSAQVVSPAPARQPDTQSAPAVVPVKFPWEQSPAQTSAGSDRPDARPRQETQQPTAERYAERADTGATEAVPAAPPRHSETRTATPTPPAPQEIQQPTAERYAERADTSATEAVGVPAAVSRPAEQRTATPNPAAREESDSPTADWYDDPDGSGGERWWDGKGWTRHRRPRSGSPATTDTGRLRAARPQAAPPTPAGPRRNAPAAGTADTQSGQAASRAPGWYRDPSGSGDRRFWDGSRWTNGT